MFTLRNQIRSLFANNNVSSLVGKQSYSCQVHHCPMPERCLGESDSSISKALILGIFETPVVKDSKDERIDFTETAGKYNHFTCNALFQQLRASSSPIRLGEARAFFNVNPLFPITIVAGLGNQCYGYNKMEQRDEAKEAVRLAVGAGARVAQDLGVSKLYTETFGITEAAAEGAALSLWVYQDLKNKNNQIKVPKLGLYDGIDWTAWQVGLEKASAQNLARQLMEAPSNITTPLLFAQIALSELCKVGISADIRVENWIIENKLDAFLAVSKGSCEQPIFLELIYTGCDPCVRPIVLIGKGITYDSGGLCLKREHQELLTGRGDMAGAAIVIAVMRAIASMNLPLNVRGVLPICENMPGASAMKPGDIVQAYNGKNILIQDTDYEGQLVLADALSYAAKYNPEFIVDVANFTKQAQDLMGASSSVVFTNHESLWASIKAASIHTGDRVWRLPLWQVYQEQVVLKDGGADYINAPLKNQSFTAAGAAFLSNFTCHHRWMHLDTYPVMYDTEDTSYLRKGMSGRPTRALVEMLAMLACKPPTC